MEELPLIDQDLLLERFPGKGGGTCVRFPEIKPDKHSYFGWQKVKGFIDGYELSKAALIPMRLRNKKQNGLEFTCTPKVTLIWKLSINILLNV